MAETTEFCGTMTAETEKAYQFFDGVERIWLPKSQIEVRKLDRRREDYEVTLPVWLAKKKGIV